MGLAVDIILFAIFVITIFASVKKGFVLSLLEMVSFIAAIILALYLGGIIAPVFYDTFLKDNMIKMISEKLPANAGAMSALEQAQVVIAGIPKFAANFVQSVGINLAELSEKAAESTLTGTTIAEALEKSLAAPIMIAVCRIILTIILFFVLSILLKLLSRLINKVFKLPVLKTMNKLLGTVIGLIKGILVVFTLVTILTVIASFMGEKQPKLVEMTEDSKIVGFVEERDFKLSSYSKIMFDETE